MSNKVRCLSAALVALSSLLVSCQGSSPPDGGWERHVKEVQERGAPVVRAVYKFQAACGLWPCSLDELVPDYASREQVRGWDFTWKPNDWWYLTDYSLFPGELLRYNHPDSTKAGWMSTDGEDDLWLKGGEVEPPKVEVSAKERDAAHVAMLRARIARCKSRIIHHQGLVCWYYSHGDYQSAWKACEKCRQQWPAHWWPNLMLAYIELKQKRADDADKRLARYTTDQDDLTHWYLVGEFYADTGRLDKARESLVKAGRAPIADLDGLPEAGGISGFSGDSIAWMAAVLCYKQGWYEEALAVCDQWERGSGLGQKNYCAIQAACYLALGKGEKAREPLRRIRERAQRQNVWAKNLEDLKKAIERNDQEYRYHPGDYPPPFSVLVEYK